MLWKVRLVQTMYNLRGYVDGIELETKMLTDEVKSNTSIDGTEHV